MEKSSESEEIVEIPVGIFVEKKKAPSAKQARRALMEKAKKPLKKEDSEDASEEASLSEEASSEKSEERSAEENVPQTPKKIRTKLEKGEKYEAGEEFVRVKVKPPIIEELDIFGRDVIADLGIPELWEQKLVPRKYAKRIVKDIDFSYAGTARMVKKNVTVKPNKYDPRFPRGTTVKFEADGETMEGVVKSIGKKTMKVMTDRREYTVAYNDDPEIVKEAPTYKLVQPKRKSFEPPKILGEPRPIYEDVPEEDILAQEARYIKRYKEEYGRTPDVVPRFSPKKIVDYKKGKVVKRGAERAYYEISPTEKVDHKKGGRPNPFNRRFPEFTRVKFEVDGEVHRGLVTDFTEYGVIVMSNKNEYKIKYVNPTLKRITKPKAAEQKPLPPTLNDLLRGQVTDSIRERVREVYKELLKEIVKVEKPANKSPSSKMKGFSMVKMLPWDKYYEENFLAWRETSFSKEIYEKLNHDELKQRAFDMTARARDSDVLLQELNEIIEMTTETTSIDIIAAFNKTHPLTPFQARFILMFKQLESHARIEAQSKAGPGTYFAQEKPYAYIERQKRIRERQKKGLKMLRSDMPPRPKNEADLPPEVKPIKGVDLAKIIGEIIRFYISTVPEVQYEDLLKEEINRGLDAMDQDQLRERFDEEFLSQLRKIYDDHKKKYDEEYEKYIEKIEKEGAKDTDVDEIEEEVIKFENIVYQNSGHGTIYRYLRRALIPHLFMHGPLASRANFFRAKLSNGDYKFSALAGANISHYLPEFVMGINREHVEIDKLFDDAGPWQILGQTVVDLLELLIEYFMDSYAAVMNPTKQRGHKNLLDQAGWLVRNLDPFLVSPVKKCMEQTGTGRRPVVKDGKYVYHGEGANRRKVYEDIPNEDLVICYQDDEFSCHSVSEIMNAIAIANGGEPINELSGKPYPEDFIKKFIERYSKGTKVTAYLDVKDVRPGVRRSPLKNLGSGSPKSLKKSPRSLRKTSKTHKSSKKSSSKPKSIKIRTLSGEF